MKQTTDKAEARWVSEVGALYDLATSEAGNTFREAGFLPVNRAVATQIGTKTGLEVFGYARILDTFSVRHILRHHGTLAERKRGQEPITKLDFLHLPSLLSVPDTIEYAGKTSQGRDVLHYTKVMEGHTVIYTEEVRTKKGRLAAVTLYKKLNR